MLMATIGCRQKGEFLVAKDEQLTVQTIALPASKGQQVFQVRIFPSRKLIEEGGMELGKKMQFEVDSCFFMVKNGIHYYPDGITPVANGMSSNFEYLLSFSKVPEGSLNDVQFVYHDKYMNQKDYQLRLN